MTVVICMTQYDGTTGWKSRHAACLGGYGVATSAMQHLAQKPFMEQGCDGIGWSRAASSGLE